MASVEDIEAGQFDDAPEGEPVPTTTAAGRPEAAYIDTVQDLGEEAVLDLEYPPTSDEEDGDGDELSEAEEEYYDDGLRVEDEDWEVAERGMSLVSAVYEKWVYRAQSTACRLHKTIQPPAPTRRRSDWGRARRFFLASTRGRSCSTSCQPPPRCTFFQIHTRVREADYSQHFDQG